MPRISQVERPSDSVLLENHVVPPRLLEEIRNLQPAWTRTNDTGVVRVLCSVFGLSKDQRVEQEEHSESHQMGGAQTTIVRHVSIRTSANLQGVRVNRLFFLRNCGWLEWFYTSPLAPAGL